MRIYLASVAPSNETHRPLGMLPIPNRLLSYYGVACGGFAEEKDVFENIMKFKGAVDIKEDDHEGK